MRSALGGGATARVEAAVPIRTSLAPTALVTSAVLLVGLAVLFSQGFAEGRLAEIGAAAIVVSATAAVAAFFGGLPRPRLTRAAAAFIALLAAFVYWNGLSVTWSIQPERSWSYLNRGLVYLAFALVGVFVACALARPLRTVCYILASVFGVLLAWSLAEKAFPPAESGLLIGFTDEVRLEGPIGFATALGLGAAMALPLALWIAATGSHRHAVRAGGVTLFYLAAVATVLTYSRGSILAALLVVGLWFAIGGPRLESLAALALALPGVAIALATAFALPGVTEEGETRATRTRDGALFVGALVAVAAAVWLAAFVVSRAQVRRPLSAASRRRAHLAVALTLGAVALTAAVSLATRADDPAAWARAQVQAFTNASAVTSGPERIGEASSNFRWGWWQQAWESFRAKPLHGTGAGSFELAQRTIAAREDLPRVTEPHNVPLQFLGETGLVGFG
ncbi:MAG: O-antigen ligase family protein, partial [Actinomycetota bacterium]|nr:O-antigen ligase family protein [Actinomycetota bacterium]